MDARRGGRILGALALVTWSCAIPNATLPVGGEVDQGSQRAAAPQPPDWQAEAERQIAEREYEASDAGLGLQAPNRAHELRTYFDGRDARVVDRSEDARGLASLRTAAFGRGERLLPLEAGLVSASANRVEVRRPGLVEWFVNTERGLEQGWTIEARPEGNGPLAIEVALGARVERVEGDRALLDAGARRLEYGSLRAFDAAGHALEARFEQAGDERVRVVVEDEGAAYPVTVDPTLSSPVFATLTSNQNFALMGSSVAGAGDTNGDGYDDVIVGAYQYDAGQTDEGAAFIFLGGPNGIASVGAAAASARLEANQANAWMGHSVAGAGDVNNDGYDDVLVGALTYDSGQTDEGAVFVFHGGPAGIANGNPSTAATILQSDQVSAQLGVSVAGAGDVNDDGYADVIVGSIFYDAGQTDEGAAFVFLGSPTGIPAGTPSNANAVLQGDQATSRMGLSVAGAGDTNGDGYDDVIVGARLYDLGQTDEGAAFVFLGSAAGIVSASALAASATLQGNQVAALLGDSVASAGDVDGDGYGDVVIGATAYDAGQMDEGAAFVFLGGAAGVGNGDPASADTFLQSDQVNAQLGESVAGAGDVDGDGYGEILVGAHVMDSGQTDEGVAILSFGSATGIASGAALISKATILQQDQTSALLGTSVAGAGDVNGDGFDDIIVGTNQYDSGQTDEGAAFIYLGGGRGLHGFPGPDSVTRSNQGNSSYGLSVAGAGDVNGDGFDDLIVGAPLYDSGQTDEGAAFVFHGSAGGIATGDPSAAATLLQSDQQFARFGINVAAAGDVNSDGFADIILAASGYNSGQVAEGAAFVFHGGPSGIMSGSPATAAAVIESNEAFASLLEVAGAGDVNNDGFADVIVGTSNYDAGQSSRGTVLAFHGGPNGVGNGSPANADTFLVGSAAGAALGYKVAGAGDTNNDGYDDVVISGNDPESGELQVYVHLGGSSGLQMLAPTIINSGQGAQLGSDVAGAGDVNGDGYADIVVGADHYDETLTDEGAVFVFHGGPAGIPSGSAAAVASAQITSDESLSEIGRTVARAGDVNGDGYDDIVVGTYGYASDRRTAFVFLGGAGGVAATSPLDAVATISEVGVFPVDVAGAGDVNGDGFDDVIVGYASYTGTIANEGGALVYYLTRPEVPPGADTIGYFVPAEGRWLLRNTNSAGAAHLDFYFGEVGQPFVYLTGDWDGDGDDTPGVYDPRSGAFFLSNSTTGGVADFIFYFGAGTNNGGPPVIPLVGDWDGDGDDCVGLSVVSSGVFYLRNQFLNGPADLTFYFGPGGAGYKPLTGDWNGDGTDTVGLYVVASGVYFLRNANATGSADVTFQFGGPNQSPVMGDWDGDGDDTVGLFFSGSNTWFLKNTNANGAADVSFTYLPGYPWPVVPIKGDWDGQ